MPKTSSLMKAPTALPSTKPDQNILTVAKGGGIVFVGQLFQYGCLFALGVLQARLLGAEQMGLCNLALTVAFTAEGLASLALPPAMVRYISLFASRRDTVRLWGTLQIGLGLVTISSLLIGIGLFVLADPIAEQVFHEPRLVHLLRVISLAVPFLALCRIVAAATRGFKKMQYTVISQNIFQPTIRFILVAALAVTVGLNAKRALAVFDVAVITSFVVLLYFLNKLFPLKRSPGTGQRDAKKILRFALPIYLTSLIDIFGGNIKTMLLGALNTVTSVGIFAAASQINMVGRMFHGGISTAAAPVVSELYDRGEWEQMKRFYQTVTKWTFTLNLPLFLIMLLFPRPILSMFGKDFVVGATALSILAWANLVKTGTGICSTVLNMTGNTSLQLINSVVLFALTLGLNILLIPRWGLMGVATASLVVAVTINLLRLSEVFILFRMLPYNMGFVKPVAAGLVALVAGWGARLLPFPEANLVHTVINVAVLLAVYGGMILLLGLSQEDRTVLARVSRRMSVGLSKQGGINL